MVDVDIQGRSTTDCDAAIHSAPGRLPFLGHSWILRHHPLEFMTSLQRSGDVSKIYLGSRQVYVLNHPDLIRRVLVTDAHSFDKGALFDQLRGYVGSGLLTSSGSFHRKQRRLMQSAFNREQIAVYAETMERIAAERADSWQDGQSLSINREMDDLAFSILTGTLFSSHSRDDIGAEIRKWLSVRIGAMGRTLSALPRWHRLLPFASRPSLDPEAIVRLRGLLDELITEYRATGARRQDILSIFLTEDAEGTGERMTDSEVRDELLTLLVAGTETTSAALAWTFHELHQAPDIEHRLHSELGRAGLRRPFSYESCAELLYVRQILKEVLRRHAVWLLMRRVVAPVRFGGLELRPGTEVCFSPYAVHHDPRFYVDPFRFDPDRWRAQSCSGPPRGAFFPFGMGNRLCLGESYAWAELIIVVATVAARWKLAPASQEPPVTPVVGTLIRPSETAMVVRARC
ncbi:cytochrome P450 [Streptomyces wuyuanensis]|uniref:cytochrome P450 n=1 Tax=Streptomyces wuyuanensis TaxID=1196353 RepID=UPI00342F2CEB